MLVLFSYEDNYRSNEYSILSFGKLLETFRKTCYFHFPLLSPHIPKIIRSLQRWIKESKWLPRLIQINRLNQITKFDSGFRHNWLHLGVECECESLICGRFLCWWLWSTHYLKSSKAVKCEEKETQNIDKSEERLGYCIFMSS